jgi:hypothetical protein
MPWLSRPLWSTIIVPTSPDPDRAASYITIGTAWPSARVANRLIANPHRTALIPPATIASAHADTDDEVATEEDLAWFARQEIADLLA